MCVYLQISMFIYIYVHRYMSKRCNSENIVYHACISTMENNNDIGGEYIGISAGD